MFPKSPHQPVRARVRFNPCTTFVRFGVQSYFANTVYSGGSGSLALSKRDIPFGLKGRETRPINVDRYD